MCGYVDRDSKGSKRCSAIDAPCLTVSGNPYDCSLVDQEIETLTHMITMQEICSRDLREYLDKVQRKRIKKNFEIMQKED
jgi:hypothetical protein